MYIFTNKVLNKYKSMSEYVSYQKPYEIMKCPNLIIICNSPRQSTYAHNFQVNDTTRKREEKCVTEWLHHKGLIGFLPEHKISQRDHQMCCCSAATETVSRNSQLSNPTYTHSMERLTYRGIGTLFIKTIKMHPQSL